MNYNHIFLISHSVEVYISSTISTKSHLKMSIEILVSNNNNLNIQDRDFVSNITIFKFNQNESPL